MRVRPAIAAQDAPPGHADRGEARIFPRFRGVPRPRDAVSLLVLVVAVDVLLAAALRADRARDFFSGRRDWESALGVFAAAYLLVVVYALVLVARHHTAIRERLRRSDATLAAHAETSSEWLWEMTPELVFTYSSRQVREVLGYAPGAVVGCEVTSLLTAASAQRVRRVVQGGVVAQPWHDIEDEWLRADGAVVVLRHSGVPIHDAAGRHLGYRGSCSVPRSERRAQREAAAARARVEEVLRTRGVTMFLQPIVAVSSGRLTGVEALARFADGRRPDVWFDEAGDAGLRFELELLAVEQALARLAELPPATSLSINACPDVIADPRFGPVLAASGAPLDRVVVEITEHIRIDQYEPLQRALARLRGSGVRVAVDDAGAGFASLSHVLRLRPDVVKLDRSLVSGVDGDRARRTLITALGLLALDIGASVTAEGVETSAELAALADLGVESAQGYFIGRPTADLSSWRDLQDAP